MAVNQRADGARTILPASSVRVAHPADRVLLDNRVVDPGRNRSVGSCRLLGRVRADQFETLVAIGRDPVADLGVWGKPTSGMNTRVLPGMFAPRYQELHDG